MFKTKTSESLNQTVNGENGREERACTSDKTKVDYIKAKVLCFYRIVYLLFLLLMLKNAEFNFFNCLAFM